MFSYVDPKVKAELLASGKLVALDDAGRRVEPHATDAVLNVLGPVPLPILLEDGEATFRWYPFVRHSELERIEHVVDEVRANGPRQLFALLADHMAVNSAVVYGDFAAATSPLVRVHSNCLTGDVFGSLRCDCGPQLHAAFTAIAAAGAGAVIYMAGHEGRGIGLWAKAVTYLLQDAGNDTYEANERLGLPADSRDFSDAARILGWLRGGRPEIRLLGNNPLKREALESAGLVVTAQEPLLVGLSRHNARYLEAKRARGHLIPEGPLTPKR